MTAKQIKDLWLYCYGENLETEYSGFYKLLKKLEKNKIEDLILFHKYKGKTKKEDVVLLDENNTFFNIKQYIREKYPNLPIEIVNEGRGDDV